MTGNSEYDRAKSAWESAVAQGVAVRDEVARALGGQLVELLAGDWPMATLRFAEQHVVLCEQARSTVSLSLPAGQEWHFNTLAEWTAIRGAVVQAIAEYRANPAGVALGDVLVKVVPIISRLAPHQISLDRAKRTAAVSAAGYRVGLAHQADAVEVKVMIGEAWQKLRVDRAALAGELVPWLEQMLAAQTQVIKELNAAREAEIQRKQALGQGRFQGVLAALRAGKTFSSGNSRYGNTYYMRDSTIHLERFDEGLTEETVLSEAQLLQVVEADPDAFS